MEKHNMSTFVYYNVLVNNEEVGTVIRALNCEHKQSGICVLFFYWLLSASATILSDF